MKNCIVMLTRSDLRTLKELKESLDRIYNNYVNDFPCDVVIFHEQGFPAAFISKASERYANIKFKEIELKAPSFLTPENLKFKDPTSNILGLSYRSMCRFYALEFFNHLKEYDWYWRLDVDSILPTKIEFDVFKYLEENNKVYGFVAQLPEHPPVVEGLGKFVGNYVKNKNIQAKFLDYLLDKDGNYNYKMIYNNFEICKLNLFKQPDVMEFLQAIDKTGSIYEYRWGDAPIRTLMLSLFIDRDKLHRFENIDYQHQDFIQKDSVIDCKYIPFEWIKDDEFIA